MPEEDTTTHPPSKTAKKKIRKPKSRLYATWSGMRQRCTNPNNNSWRYYGGRGIKVCERWESFKTFAEDMGEPPTPKHTLERLDNNGNYEPGNCKWATQIEQARNTSRTFRITINGQLVPFLDWCDAQDMSLRQRFYVRKALLEGLTLEEAIDRPIPDPQPRPGGNIKQAALRRTCREIGSRIARPVRRPVVEDTEEEFRRQLLHDTGYLYRFSD